MSSQSPLALIISTSPSRGSAESRTHTDLASGPGCCALQQIWMRDFRSGSDCVEKLICASERERLIQDQAPTRNNDSRTDPPGFLYCKFCFHSARSASFSTQSALNRHRLVRPRMPVLGTQRTFVVSQPRSRSPLLTRRGL